MQDGKEEFTQEEIKAGTEEIKAGTEEIQKFEDFVSELGSWEVGKVLSENEVKNLQKKFQEIDFENNYLFTSFQNKLKKQTEKILALKSHEFFARFRNIVKEGPWTDNLELLQKHLVNQFEKNSFDIIFSYISILKKQISNKDSFNDMLSLYCLFNMSVEGFYFGLANTFRIITDETFLQLGIIFFASLQNDDLAKIYIDSAVKEEEIEKLKIEFKTKEDNIETLKNELEKAKADLSEMQKTSIAEEVNKIANDALTDYKNYFKYSLWVLGAIIAFELISTIFIQYNEGYKIHFAFREFTDLKSVLYYIISRTPVLVGLFFIMGRASKAYKRYIYFTHLGKILNAMITYVNSSDANPEIKQEFIRNGMGALTRNPFEALSGGGNKKGFSLTELEKISKILSVNFGKNV